MHRVYFIYNHIVLPIALVKHIKYPGTFTKMNFVEYYLELKTEMVGRIHISELDRTQNYF